ncbi:hypothetical protein PVAP13_6NG357300 [Panicum virgatum]|uniref:Uncharacterized protein n=1 Tax=Panicum virgatum TaxID=38727 RepID=A0A8T0R6G2_PANVG|nr:hypothetical protein PVAP13_6NG357300 [Panicum virgatum]
MTNSICCSCSSSHVNLLLWKVLETMDHLLELGVAICFDRRCVKDPSMEIAISLASANCLTTLQLSRSTEVGFLLIFLNCFCAFLAKRIGQAR